MTIGPGIIVWKKLGHRPPLSKVPAGTTVWSAGFRKVGETLRMLKEKNHHVVSYLTAVLFFEAGNGSIISAATTFITQQLKISDPSHVLIFIVIITVVGASLVPTMNKYLGVKGALMLAITLSCMGTLTVVL